MKGKIFSQKFERGQVLIIVALGLVALIAMAALIVDGAILMSHRRTAQAAADAAALAGAEYLCPNVYSESSAISVAENYVGLNGADVLDVSLSTEFDNTIHVETQIESTSFFSRILNQLGLSAAAMAEASCTPLSSGAHMLPIVYPCWPVKEGEDVAFGGNCKIVYGDKTTSIQENLDAGKMTIIMNSTSTKDLCEPEGPIDCDLDDDGLNDLISMNSRGFISFEKKSSGASDLCDWVINGSESSIGIGYWLSTLTAYTAKIYNSCFTEILGKDVYVPIYNHQCEKAFPSEECSTWFQSGDNEEYVVSGSGIPNFRVHAFGLFRITCVSAPSGDYSMDGSDTCLYKQYLIDSGVMTKQEANSISSVEGYFVEGTSPIGGGDGEPTGLYTVHLRR